MYDIRRDIPVGDMKYVSTWQYAMEVLEIGECVTISHPEFIYPPALDRKVLELGIEIVHKWDCIIGHRIWRVK
jgi:hypothetical protein